MCNLHLVRHSVAFRHFGVFQLEFPIARNSKISNSNATRSRTLLGRFTFILFLASIWCTVAARSSFIPRVTAKCQILRNKYWIMCSRTKSGSKQTILRWNSNAARKCRSLFARNIMGKCILLGRPQSATSAQHTIEAYMELGTCSTFM